MCARGRRGPLPGMNPRLFDLRSGSWGTDNIAPVRYYAPRRGNSVGVVTDSCLGHSLLEFGQGQQFLVVCKTAQSSLEHMETSI